MDNNKEKWIAKKALYEKLGNDVTLIAKGNLNTEDKLKAICKLLKDNVSIYDWAGFYAVDKENPTELILISYIGEPTEHKRIPFGKGICGQAASLKKTFVVQDVSKEINYLSCSAKVKSEIVVPIFKANKLVGELDIDSHTVSPFTREDETLLSRIAKVTSVLF